MSPSMQKREIIGSKSPVLKQYDLWADDSAADVCSRLEAVIARCHANRLLRER
jgi:hypothetical protein